MELTLIHNRLKSDERQKGVQRKRNPRNHLNVRPILFILVMFTYFYSLSFGAIQQLDLKAADPTEFARRNEAFINDD